MQTRSCCTRSQHCSECELGNVANLTEAESVGRAMQVRNADQFAAGRHSGPRSCVQKSERLASPKSPMLSMLVASERPAAENDSDPPGAICWRERNPAKPKAFIGGIKTCRRLR